MRSLPVWAALLFLLCAGVWLARDKERARHVYPPGSARNTGERGASLARAILARDGGVSGLLETGLVNARLPARALLVRIEPSPPLVERGPEERIEPLGGADDAGCADRDGGVCMADAGADAGPRGFASLLEDELDGGDLFADDSEKRDAGRARQDDEYDEDESDFDPFLLSEADEQFVRNGGALLIAARGDRVESVGDDDDEQDGGGAGAEGGLGTATHPESAEAEEADAKGDQPLCLRVAPLFTGPNAFIASNREIALPPSALIDAQPIFETGAAPVLARRALGRGELWTLGDPALLENGEMGGDVPAVLLQTLARDRPVYFDETVHGLGREEGPIELLRRWGLGPAMALGLLCCGIFFWRRAAVLGPDDPPPRDLRAEAVDYVDAAASLFQRALGEPAALKLYRGQIIREISWRLACAPEAAERWLHKYAPNIPSGGALTQAQFQAELKLLTQALERFRDEHRFPGRD